MFAARNVVDYLALEDADPFWRFFVAGFNPLNFRVHEALIALAILRKKVNNLLNIRTGACRPIVSATARASSPPARSGPDSPFTATDDPNFLRANLVRHLAERDAEFDFMVQRRTRPTPCRSRMPRSNGDETDAPFVPVARITIPKQTFDVPEQMAFCENLSFSPWHCIDAHRSSGWTESVAQGRL